MGIPQPQGGADRPDGPAETPENQADERAKSMNWLNTLIIMLLGISVIILNISLWGAHHKIAELEETQLSIVKHIGRIITLLEKSK